MVRSKPNTVIYKLFSLISVVRGYNILILVLAQYLAAIFIFSPQKSLRKVLLNYELFFIVLASVFVVAAGYIINNFYDVKADKINRPLKAGIDNIVTQHTKLRIYFLFNFLGFLFSWFISWKAALFFSVYIFGIWLYSHKLKKHPFIGLISAATLTLSPFFVIFVYFQNFSKIIFVHATFLFSIILLRQIIKDLENLRGAMANDYITIPIKYGERKSRKLGLLCVLGSFIPISILISYPHIGYMRYYFLFSFIVLMFIGYALWKSNLKKHYVMLHNLLKLMLLLGILSLVFIDPEILIERVIDKLN